MSKRFEILRSIKCSRIPENAFLYKKENSIDMFGKNVFSMHVMKQRLPKDIYKSLSRTVENFSTLDPAVADVVANAMKDWAIEKGATHYAHVFSP